MKYLQPIKQNYKNLSYYNKSLYMSLERRSLFFNSMHDIDRKPFNLLYDIIHINIYRSLTK